MADLSSPTTVPLLDEALELAEILRPQWPALSASIPSGTLRLEGDDDGDDKDEGKDDDDKADDRKDDKPDDDKPFDQDDPDRVESDDDWKTKSRKNERAATRERKKREEAERKLKEREDEDKSEHEKDLEKAREEARKEATTEAEKDRRSDRLEVAVTRLAARGVKIGEGDEAKTVKFADTEDALLRVERGIRRGDIDADDIYDDEGQVKTDALTGELAQIASDNPHLVGEGGSSKPAGDADGRKGDPAQKDLEAMSPEDHAKRKYPDNKK